MNNLEKKVIYYDGIWDLSVLGKQNKVAYTSVKTTSSSMMTQEEFKDYINTGFGTIRDVYIHKDYKTMI